MKTKSVRHRLLASTMIFGSMTLAMVSAGAAAAQAPPPNAAQSAADQAPVATASGAAAQAPTTTSPPFSTTTQAAGAATPTTPGLVSPPTAAVSEVVITGSRIAGTTNLNSPSPVAVASHEDIVLSKATQVEEALERIPGVDFNGGESESTNNGGAGAAVVSIRNLGPQRTLVLIDGQRLIPSGSSPDLNEIPLSIIDHIEVLKDGASSIYGADAIGGVINLITKRHQEGLTAEANYGESSHGDGKAYGISSTLGLNSDRGDVLISAGWNHRDAIPQSNRAWGTDTHADDPNFPGGSAWRTQLDILQGSGETLSDANGNVTSPAISSNTVFANGQKYSTKNPVVATLAPNLAYISGLGKVKLDSGGVGFSTITSGLDQKEITINGHYKVTDNISIVTDGFFSDEVGHQLLRPEPLLGAAAIATTAFPGFIVPADAPGNIAGQSFAAYLTPAQFGPRTYDEDTKTYRIRAGFEGSFMDNRFKWEAGYVYQNSTFNEDITNEGNFLNLAQITEQLNCVNVPGGCKAAPAGLTNAFGQAITSIPVTQPNYFGNPTSIFTRDQLNFLEFDNNTESQSFERYAYGDISGTLFDLPAGPVKAALGFENREEFLSNLPNALTVAGYAPNAQNPTRGGYNVASLYGEFQIPVLADLPFVKSLTFAPSARYDDYSTFGGAQTYKIGVDYEVSRDIRFRGAYSTAFRAPQVSELYDGTVISDNGASGDPCDVRKNYNGNSNTGTGVLTAGSTCSKAVAKGAAVTNFNDSIDEITNDQISTLEGGNVNLQPEKSREITAGFVLSPRWTPGLTIAADYYDIIISNTILINGVAGTNGDDFVLNGCYGPEQNQAFCNLITRTADGTISQVNSLNTNFGVEKTQGVDYEINYSSRAGHLNLPMPGQFNVNVQATNLLKLSQTNADGSTTNYRGFFNVAAQSNIYPLWRGIFTFDYALAGFKIRYDLRYIRHTWDLDGGVKSGVYGDTTPDMTYHDISLSYDLPTIASAVETRLVFGIDNLLDKDPPFNAQDGTCKCNTLAGPFDVVGRFYYGKLTGRF